MSARLFRILTTVLLGVMAATLAAALAFSLTFPQQLQRAEIEIACVSARSNISQLQALESVARTLGLPDTIEVPALPEECR